MKRRTFEMMGWWLFVVSAIAYLIASWGNLWGMIGSLTFLGACFLFLLPFYFIKE